METNTHHKARELFKLLSIHALIGAAVVAALAFIAPGLFQF